MSPNSPRTYLGRFYILAVASLLALQQNATWMTFSTIPEQSKNEFDLSDDMITLLAGIFVNVGVPIESACMHIIIISSYVSTFLICYNVPPCYIIGIKNAWSEDDDAYIIL